MAGKIFVTGATGAVGQYLVDELIQRHVDMRVGVRTPAKFPVKDDAPGEVVHFDFADPQTYEQALAGVEKLFLLTPPPSLHPQELNLCAPLIDAAAHSGVQHIVRLSSMWALHAPTSSHRMVEQYVEAAGVSYTHLRPNIFMQNFNLSQRAGLRNNSALYISAGDGAVSFVDIRDVAAAAAVVLTSAGHESKAYTLTGGESLTYQAVADRLSQVLGRTIVYRRLTDEGLRTTLQAAGWQAGLIDYVSELYAAVKAGQRAVLAPDLAALLQRSPISFEQYAVDHAAYWL